MAITHWPHKVEPYTFPEVRKYCVNDPDWQRFRLSLKGLSTREKLVALDVWREAGWFVVNAASPMSLVSVLQLSEKTRIQVDNYINAMRRGGQLDKDNNIVY